MSAVEFAVTLTDAAITADVVESAFRSAATVRVGDDGTVNDLDLYDVPLAVARAAAPCSTGHDTGPPPVEPGRALLDLDGGWLWLPLCAHPSGTPVDGVAEVVAHHTTDRLVDLTVRLDDAAGERWTTPSPGSTPCPST